MNDHPDEDYGEPMSDMDGVLLNVVIILGLLVWCAALGIFAVCIVYIAGQFI